MNQKQGFTLAEVLITLAIIGIVAAITIPSVIANNQKQEWVSGLQKAYNTLNQAIALSQAENGELTNWEWNLEQVNSGYIARKYLFPYLKLHKDCNNGDGCMGQGNYKQLWGANAGNLDQSTGYYKFQLNDGTSWMTLKTAGDCIAERQYCLTIYVDVNGKKGPNQRGRDMFFFRLLPFTNQLIHGDSYSRPYDESTNTWQLNNADICCTTGCDGSCGAKIARDGWQMKY